MRSEIEKQPQFNLKIFIFRLFVYFYRYLPSITQTGLTELFVIFENTEIVGLKNGGIELLPQNEIKFSSNLRHL